MAEQKVRTSGLMQPGMAAQGSRFSSAMGNVARPITGTSDMVEPTQQPFPNPAASPKPEASRPVVVQCPSCRTKFALDAAALSNVERPRFHCTKCDTTFTKSSVSLMHATAPNEATHLAAEPPPLQAPTVAFEYHTELSQIPDIAPPPEFSPIPEFSGAPGDAVGDMKSWMPRESVDPDLLTEERVERIPTNEDFQEFAARHRAQENSAREESSPTPPPAAEPAPTRATGRAPVVPASPAPVKPLTAGGRGQSAGQQPLQTASKAFSGLSGMNRTVKPIPEAPGPKATPWRNLAIAIAPVGITLLLAGIITAYLLEKPRSLAAITPSLFSSAQHVAPPQLEIVTTSFQQVGLENGENILVISGKVSNKTDKAFQRVDIQGITFDGSGAPLQKQLTAAGSVLTKAHLSNLSSRIIAELQAGSLHKNSPLKAGQTVDFVIGLIPDAATTDAGMSTADAHDDRAHAGVPAFYGARVYSVR